MLLIPFKCLHSSPVYFGEVINARGSEAGHINPENNHLHVDVTRR